MNSEFYLFWANAVVWIGISIYILFLGLAQRNIKRRLGQLERLKDE